MSGDPTEIVEDPVPPPGAFLTNAPPAPPPPGPIPATVTTAVAATPAAEPEPEVEIPSWTRRIIIGVLTAIGLIFLLVVIPTQLLARVYAAPIGFSTPVPTGAIVLSGLVIALLIAARGVVRPTKAFGPVSTAGSIVSVLYLLYLAPLASAGVGVDKVGVTLAFGGLLLLLAIVPLLGACAGIVATVEDFARPGERVRYEYRARF